MKYWKKITSKMLALGALALAAALVLSASASTGNVNLMAVNERVLLDLTADNMPRTVGGVLYVPYTMLSYQATGIDLGTPCTAPPSARCWSPTGSWGWCSTPGPTPPRICPA